MRSTNALRKLNPVKLYSLNDSQGSPLLCHKLQIASLTERVLSHLSSWYRAYRINCMISVIHSDDHIWGACSWYLAFDVSSETRTLEIRKEIVRLMGTSYESTKRKIKQKSVENWFLIISQKCILISSISFRDGLSFLYFWCKPFSSYSVLVQMGNSWSPLSLQFPSNIWWQ